MKIRNSANDPALARRTVLVALLGLAGLLGITVMGTSRLDVAPARDDAVSAPAVKSAAVARRARPFGYIQSGQWLADARTYTEMIRYLLDPELPIKPIGVSPSPQVARPTTLSPPPPAAWHFVNARRAGTAQRCWRRKRPQARLAHPPSVK